MADRIDLDLDPSFRGMLVVGDIHGHVDLMERMVVHARERGLFFVSCGDLVDRGPDSVGCLLRMRDLVAGGRGLWIRGNHEDKLYRALKGRMVKVTTPLQVTMEQLAAHEHGPAIRDGFLEAFEAAPFAVRRGNLFVVHGGFGVRMLDLDPMPQPLRVRALFGQPARQRKPDGKPIRLYRWVNEIPDGMSILIGHDPCCDDCLLERVGVQGGRAIHIDSAAGKCGPLSAVETCRDGHIVAAIQVRRDKEGIRPIEILPYSLDRVRRTEEPSATDGP